jgi:hypothetical protein
MTQSLAHGNVVKLRNIIDVTDPAYGSTRNTTMLQAALDAADDGDALYVPAGDSFSISSAWTFTGRQNVTAHGPGHLSIAAGVEGIVVTGSASQNSEFVRFSGLRLTGTSTSTGFSLKSNNLENLHTVIEDCDLETFQYGIRSQNGNSNLHEICIRQNRLTNTDIAGSVGILLDSGDNEIISNVIRGFETGARIDRGAVRIHSNHFYRSPSASTVCDLELAVTGQTVVNASVVGNYFDGQPSGGSIKLDAFYARHTTIMGNNFLSNAAAGPFISITAGSAGTNVKHLVITGNTFRSSDAGKTNGVTIGTNAVTTATEQFFCRDNTWEQCTPYHFSSEEISQAQASRTNTADGSMRSFAVPANTLHTNGNALKIRYAGRAATQDAVPVLKYGSATLASFTVTAGNQFVIEATVLRTAAATQTCTVTINNNGTITNSEVSATETLSGAVTVDFRGSVTAGGTLFLNEATVETRR